MWLWPSCLPRVACLKSKAKRRRKNIYVCWVGEAAVHSFTAFSLSATDDPQSIGAGSPATIIIQQEWRTLFDICQGNLVGKIELFFFSPSDCDQPPLHVECWCLQEQLHPQRFVPTATYIQKQINLSSIWSNYLHDCYWYAWKQRDHSGAASLWCLIGCFKEDYHQRCIISIMSSRAACDQQPWRYCCAFCWCTLIISASLAPTSAAFEAASGALHCRDATQFSVSVCYT